MLPDLIQEGNIGLLKAIDKFDCDMGNRLSTYASWWIRQSILRSIEDKASTIRIPVHLNEKMKKHSEALASDKCSDAESVKSDNLYYSLQKLKDPASLDEFIGEDGSTLQECIPDRRQPPVLEMISKYQLREQMEEIMKDLSCRDKRILQLRFGIGVDEEYTLEKVGEEFGLTRERIRQLEKKAILMIRDSRQEDAFFERYSVDLAC